MEHSIDQGSESAPLPPERASLLRKRLEALETFVLKPCFRKRAPKPVVAQLDQQAAQVSHLLGLRASQFPVDLSVPPEEIDAECMTDPQVQAALLQFEDAVGKVRGRKSGRVDFQHLGITG